jgi:hypothetical protein
MGKVINYFTPGNGMTKTEARIYGGAMVALLFIRLAFDHHCLYISTMLGMHARAACCSLLYRKVRSLAVPFYSKAKANFTLEQVMKAQRGSTEWQQNSLNPGTLICLVSTVSPLHHNFTSS